MDQSGFLHRAKRALCFYLVIPTWFLLMPTSGGWAEEAKTKSVDEAIARGNLAEVKRHVGANPKAANQGEHPKLAPLGQAILRKRPKIALYLIESGADVNKLDSSARTPLHLCVERNLPEVAAALLKAKAKPNEWDRAGWTPLHHAAAKNRVKVAMVLVEGGVDLGALSQRGGTPLHEAAVSGSPEMVRFLINQGVDPSIKAKNGDTALSLATASKNEAIIEILKTSLSDSVSSKKSQPTPPNP